MLSDIIEPRVTELGKIKIGRKSDQVRKTQSGHEWRAPEKIDHFIVTGLQRDKDGLLVADKKLMECLSADGFADPDGKLRRLPIRLLSNEPEDVMQASYCWYGGRSIGARSDGKTVTWFVGRTKEDWCKRLHEPVTEPWKEEYLELVDGRGNKLFKQHVTFNCVIASAASKFGGVHRFRTTSSITGSQLYGGLMHILQLTGGVLVGLPLQLVVRPLQVSPTVNGSQVNTTVYVVHVELAGQDLQAIQDMALKQAKFMLAHQSGMTAALTQYRKMLRAPGHELSEQEIADVNEEFSPETVEPRDEVPMPRATDEPPPPPKDHEVPAPPEPTAPPETAEAPQTPPDPQNSAEKPPSTVHPRTVDHVKQAENSEPPTVEAPKPAPDKGLEDAEALANWAEWLRTKPGLDALNDCLPKIKKLSKRLQRPCWKLVEEYAQGYGVQFDEAQKKFKPVEETP